MGLLKRRKNKKFSYEPRFYKGDGNPYEIKHKFDDFRTTVGDTPNFKQKLNRAIEDYKNNTDKASAKRFLIIFLVLLLVALFIIDFDLSIFFKN